MTKSKLTPFKQALLDVQLEQWQSVLTEEDTDFQPSEAFQEKSRKLIENAKQGNWRKMSTGLRRIILVAAILAALAMTVLAIPAVREKLTQFFAIHAGTHFEFGFDSEQTASAPDRIEKVYRPTYIPAGFEEDYTFVGWTFATSVWVAQDGENITLLQMIIPDDNEGPAPDAEDVETATLNWNGYQVFCVYGGMDMYYWTDNEYFYALYMPTRVSKEDQYRVFSSIAIDKDAELPK